MDELEKPFSKWEWSLYYIFLPLAFIVIFIAIVFVIMGYDFKQSAEAAGKNIPFVSTMLSDQTPESSDHENEKVVDQLTLELEQLQADVTLFEEKVVQKDQVINQLTTETEKLTAKVSDLTDQLEEKEQSEQERKKRIKDLANLYEKMSSKSAATILESLEISEVTPIIEQINDNRKSAILAKMDPSTAAEITLALKKLK